MVMMHAVQFDAGSHPPCSLTDVLPCNISANPALSPACPPPSPPAEEDLGEFAGSFSAAVAVHDVAALRITPLEGPLDDSWRPWHQQPLYAPQPANLAVPGPEVWIREYRPATPGKQQPQQQQEDDEEGEGDMGLDYEGDGGEDEEQQQSAGGAGAPQPRHRGDVGSSGGGAGGLPSFVLPAVGIVVALAAVGGMVYIVSQHLRASGWQPLEDKEASRRKAGELARLVAQD